MKEKKYQESFTTDLKIEEHDYLYFVAKDKCSHEFSTNYDDHLKAVKKYQLRQ